MRSYFLIVALVSVIVVSSASSAQVNPNLETGFKPFGSYDPSTFDSINIPTGNLVLHIPLFEYPQRGTSDFQAFLTYNGKGWVVKEDCVTVDNCTAFWSWNPNTLSGGGGSLRLMSFAGPAERFTSSWRKVNALDIFTAYDDYGSVHQLAKTANGTFRSIDASGIYDNGVLPGNSGEVILSRKAIGLNAGFLRDPNGNYFSSGLDTLGRRLNLNANDGSGTAGCLGPLTIVNSIINSYPAPNGGTRLVKLCTVNVPLKSNFRASTWAINQTLTPIADKTATFLGAIQSVIVFNGTSWTTSPQWVFEYNDRNAGDTADINYGSLTKVTLPSGGTITYTWRRYSLCDQNALTPVSRGVATRTIDAQDGAGPQVTTYGGSLVTDPAGNDTMHQFTGLGGTCSLYETKTDVYTGPMTAGNLLKTVVTDYQWTTNPFDQVGDGTQTVANVVAIRVTTKLPIGASFLVSKVETDYDAGFTFNYGTVLNGTFGLVKEKREYDFGNNSPGALLRKTDYTYAALSNTNYSNANLLDLVTQATVQDGSSHQVSQTTYGYDETTLQPSGVTTQHLTTLANPGFRGNQTSVKQWLNTTGGTINAQTRYYDTGMPYIFTDPKGNQTQYTYDSTFAGAYVTQTQYSSTGSPPVSHIIKGGYDFNTGLLTAFTDQNNQISSYIYDVLGRLTSASYPDGGGITVGYTDTVPVQIQKTAKLTTSLDKITNTVFDGLGRPAQTQLTSDPDGTTYVDIKYDGLGRVSKRSNPHRTAASPTDGTTSYGYDALGRAKTVTQPDGSTVLTSYSGKATDVMDEGNGNGGRRVERVSQMDGLGRVASVCEVTSSTQLGSGGTPGACGQDIAKTGFLTSYIYDVLGNVLSVAQGSLSPRSFAYDSLSRLLCAANPEIASVACPNPDNGTYTAGTVRFGYDLDSNLLTKTAPKPNQSNNSVTVTTTYGYDALNRMTGISYNDGSTPSVTILYDQSSETGAANDVGRRTYASVSSGSTVLHKRSLVTYDQMGRLQLEYQCAPDTCAVDRYNVGYAYNLIGDEKTVTAGFPAAGSQTQTNLYTSAGRLQKVSTTLAQFSILDNIHYTPLGAPLSASVGPSMAESWTYNNRGRIASIAAAGPGSGGLQNFYTENLLYAPNGDVTTLNDSVNGNWLNTYDDFNRVSTAVASNAGKGCSFGYDRYGNRWQESPSSGTCNSGSLSFNANNRIIGSNYDAAGNLLNDGLHTYTYDAENRILSVDGSTTYVYDADGRRVGKKAGGVFVAEYILDKDGRQFAQLGVGGNLVRGEVYAGGQHVATYNGQGLFFTFPDHLGTERIRRNADGSALETCTNLPFGDGQQCSGTDVSALHFSGKERDSESNLDMFGARYYGSNLGRFMTPDWAAKPTAVPYAMFGNPQSLNLYSYVNNNPTTTLDPDGHCLEDACVIEGGIVVTAMAVAYLSSPPGQQMLHNAGSGITSLGSSISSFFHPNNSGQNAPPPPTTPTNVSQGAPGTTATNVPQGTPASTSQQGAVDNSPIESRSFSPGVKAGADANAGGRCEYCGVQTVPSQQSQAGVTTPSNARQTDHYIPSSQAGSNTADNAVNSCATCNNQKSNTQPQGTQYELPRMRKPDGQ